MRITLKYKKSLVFIAWLLILGSVLAGCGNQTVSEQQYRESVKAAADELNRGMDELAQLFAGFSSKMEGEDKQPTKEMYDELVSELAELEQRAQKLRDLKEHENYAEIQAKYRDAAQKYLEAFSKYRHAFTGIAGEDISQTQFDDDLVQANSLLTEGAGILSEANTMMLNKNAK